MVAPHCVIGHGIGGFLIPAKCATHLKLIAGVSDDRTSPLDLTATQID